MKILRINATKAFFIRPGDWKGSLAEEDQSYKPITGITKEDLFAIVDYLMTGEIVMDEYKEDLISNPAERIVYQQIYEGLKRAIDEKDRIIADVDSRFEPAMKKYD